MEKNTFITGIPRSGTSLLTHLFSLDSNNVCLSEPDFIKKIKQLSSSKTEVIVHLNHEILNIRNQIASGHRISMRVSKDDSIPDNYFARDQVTGNQAKTLSTLKRIKLNRTDSTKNIVIKNNLLFTSCLDGLVSLGDVLAIIRHPLPVLLSWRSLNIPVSKGNVHTGVKYSNALNHLPPKSQLLLRQIKIMDWFYAMYKRYDVNLIQYEDLVMAPQSILEQWIDDTLLPPLTSKNDSSRYTDESTEEIEHFLKNHSELYNEVYKK